MAVKILEVKREHCPAARLIGKRYEGSANWGQWWENDWFSVLEEKQPLAFNGDAYIGAVQIADGRPQRWIGMFFPTDTQVPEGFEFIDIEPMDYGVCYLYEKENSGEFYTIDTHNRCLEELKANGKKTTGVLRDITVPDLRHRMRREMLYWIMGSR